MTDLLQPDYEPYDPDGALFTRLKVKLDNWAMSVQRPGFFGVLESVETTHELEISYRSTKKVMIDERGAEELLKSEEALAAFARMFV